MPASSSLPSELARLSRNDILAAVGGNQASYERGSYYFADSRISGLTWDGRLSRVMGMVRGNAAYPYFTLANLRLTNRSVSIQSSACTCPVGKQCKHVAALLLTAREHARAGTRPVQASVTPPWRRKLDSLLPPQDALLPAPTEGYTPLGLQFRVDGITRALEPSPLDPTPPPITLSVRPVFQDTKGKWKSDYGLTWHGGSSYYPRHSFDRRIEQWLSALASINQDIARYSWSESSWQQLDNFAESGLWTVLEKGRRLGVPFVGNAARDQIVVADTASLRLNLLRDDDGAIGLTRLLSFDDQPARLTLLGAVGQHGLFGVEIGPDTRVVTLAPAQPRLTDDDLSLLGMDAVTIPAEDVDEFMATVYPSLHRRLNLVSLDDSVALPTPPRPVLVCNLTSSVWRADVAWQWRYDTVLCPFADEDSVTTFRDAAVEQAICENVEQVVRSVPGFVSFWLHAQQSFEARGGFEAKAFVEQVLPLLESMPDVQVETIGEMATYMPAAESPRIIVRADDAGDNDWFSLGVDITVGDISIPFQDVFVALAAGQTQLILGNGEVVNIDTPELIRLKQLIEEARALSDRPSGDLKISRYQAGLWDELVDIATEAEQADRWRSNVTDLLALVDRGESIGHADLPPGLTATLRPYQISGFEWLTFLAAHGLGGILADDMGLGKTVEILAMIASTMGDGDNTPYLVLAPASVVGNWKAEAARFTPGLRVMTLPETMARSDISVDDLISVDVVVASYTIFRLDYDMLSQVSWRGLILDEAQFVKNPNTKGNQLARSLSAKIKLAVTGTPLENDVMELWALLAIVAPGFAGSSRRFRELYGAPITRAATVRQRRRFAAQHSRPAVIPADEETIQLGDASLARLRRRLRPLLLRRTKDVVAPELPDRLEQVTNVELAPRHRIIYDTYLQRERQRVLGMLGDMDKNRFAIFRSLTILRRLALDASLIEPAKYATVPSAKLDTLMEQVSEVVSSGHRALVFSQFTTFLAKVTERFDRAGIEYAYLDGHTTHRDKVIQRFRDDGLPVFCLSLKAGGFGLTLTEADYVFLLDPWWNPATEQQAIDRTHRIGQTQNVMVVRLVSQNTIEDKVLALQARKREVFNAVLADDAGEASFAATLTADDIRSLLLD